MKEENVVIKEGSESNTRASADTDVQQYNESRKVLPSYFGCGGSCFTNSYIENALMTAEADFNDFMQNLANEKSDLIKKFLEIDKSSLTDETDCGKVL